MRGDGEALEHPLIGNFAPLGRVDEEQFAAGFEHAGEFFDSLGCGVGWVKWGG